MMQRKKFESSQKNKNSGIWIFGKHPTFMALEKKRRKIYQILVTQASLNILGEFLKKTNLQSLKDKVRVVDNNYIELIIGKNQIHQGFALNCSNLEVKYQNDLIDELENIKEKGAKLPTLLIMDQLTDPHNIGAIIRSASAFGVDKIIFPENNFAKESAIMVKSSSGTIENVDLFMVVNLSKLMEKLKQLDYWCVGLAGEAKSELLAISNYENIALIIGSEGDGIRSLVKKNCDLLVKIPMNRDVESLNASVACSIALYEISKNAKK